MTEFQELIKDAPKFESMERGELVAHAYGMFAAGNKSEAENAKLRQMVWVMRDCLADECKRCSEHGFPCEIDHDMQELGIGICDLAADGELGIEVDR